MNQEQISGLVSVYGWEEIFSKNPYMYSWLKGKSRINFYYTTGTLTIQSERGGIEKYYNIDTFEKLEEIVSKP